MDSKRGVEVYHSAENQSAHYGNLMMCGSVWTCPVCAAKITEKRKAELGDALVAHQDEYKYYMGTFTMSHKVGDKLSDLLGAVNDAFRKMKMGRAWLSIKARYGIVGYITALEVTYGVNGWHVHKHTLFVCSRLLSGPEVAQFQNELYQRFDKGLRKFGFHTSAAYGVEVKQSDKRDQLEYLGKWGMASELTKALIKKGRAGGLNPWQMLEAISLGADSYRPMFIEYANEFKGKRQLVWSDG